MEFNRSKVKIICYSFLDMSVCSRRIFFVILQVMACWCCNIISLSCSVDRLKLWRTYCRKELFCRVNICYLWPKEFAEWGRPSFFQFRDISFKVMFQYIAHDNTKTNELSVRECTLPLNSFKNITSSTSIILDSHTWNKIVKYCINKTCNEFRT